MFNKVKYKIWHHLNKKYGNNTSSNVTTFKDIEFVPPEKTYKTLVAITGFGYSGSGALLDFLTEFKNTTVLSDADPDGSLRNKNYTSGTNELNLLRHSGGLFFLEKFFPSRNIFIQDCVIKMFLALVKEHYVNNGSIFNNEFLRLTKEFLTNIIDIKFNTPYGTAYQPHIPAIGNQSPDFLDLSKTNNQYLFSLKTISKEEYINYAKIYIQKFLKTINSEEYLILDQALSDNECDITHYKEYIDNLKLIAVYRDPRDLYATAISKNVTWIPHDIDKFIKWYRRSVTPYFENKNDDYLLIRFEDLVLKKKETQGKIEKFLGFEPNSHIAPKTAFDESVSINNIGLYNTINKPNEIKKIEEELSEYLYKFELSEENQPLVSICALSYNHSKYIKEAVESFWNQEYKNIEIIALDDGSSDNSAEILKELAKISPCPMRVLTQENTGNVPANFNRIMKEAKGKYIGIIALDDYLYPYAISEKIPLMERDEDIIFVCNSLITRVINDSLIPTNCYLADTKNPIPQDILEAEYNHVNPYYCQGTFYRTDTVKEVDYFDEDMIIDDDVLICKTAIYLKENPSKKFITFNHPACYYRVLDNSYSKKYVLSVKMFQQILDKYFPDRKPSKKYKERIKMVIKHISYQDFKSFRYFKNENKSQIEEWLFFYLYKNSKLFRLIVK